MTAPIGRLLSVVIDCPDPTASADFWQAVLGYRRHHTDDDWVTIVDPVDETRRISFQQIDDHLEPTWPGGEHPQQMHLDLLVDDIDEADARAVALGARRLAEPVVHPDETFRVYADPAGHPFCLVHQPAPS